MVDFFFPYFHGVPCVHWRGKGLSVRWDLGGAFEFSSRHCGTYSRPQMIPKDGLIRISDLIYIVKIRDLFYSTMRNSECEVTFYIRY